MNLESLVRKRDYYEQGTLSWVRNIWVRKASLDHFIKYNKLRLSARGAVVKIGRDYFVDVEKFPIVAIEILGIQDLEEDAGADMREGGSMS